MFFFSSFLFNAVPVGGSRVPPKPRTDSRLLVSKILYSSLYTGHHLFKKFHTHPMEGHWKISWGGGGGLLKV